MCRITGIDYDRCDTPAHRSSIRRLSDLPSLNGRGPDAGPESPRNGLSARDRERLRLPELFDLPERFLTCGVGNVAERMRTLLELPVEFLELATLDQLGKLGEIDLL